MEKKKINTKLAAVVIVVLVITVGIFVWKYEDIRYKISSQNNQKNIISQIENVRQKSADAQGKKKQPELKEVLQPEMPTMAEESNKSPQELVKDFYEWYIGNIDYNYYLVRKSSGKEWIDVKDLIKKSPFVSSTYEKNMSKTSGGDPVLCSQDTNNNMFKGLEDLVTSGDNAKVYVLVGINANTEEAIKIQVMLKQEKKQWKIDEINCSQFRL